MADVGRTVYLESVSAKFDRNRPFAALTLSITVGDNVKSQEIVIEEGKPIRWTVDASEQIDCTDTEMCTLKLYKKWISRRFPRFLACIDIPLKNILPTLTEEPYIFVTEEVKSGIKFTLTFTSSSNKQYVNTASASIPVIPSERTNDSEDLETKFRRVTNNVTSSRVAANSQNVLLDLPGDVRDTAGLIGEFVLAVGEINPYAKAATTALKTLVKLCNKQEDCYKATKELVKELEAFLQIKDQALQLEKDQDTFRTRDVERMLELIAQISDYISEHATTRRFGNMFSSKLKDKVEEFKKEFARAKDSFDRGIGLAVLETIHNSNKQSQWQTALFIDQWICSKLHPAMSMYKTGKDHICLEGTRKSLLNHSKLWTKQSLERFFWIFGLAGSGKSAFANTFAGFLDGEEDIDLTCYFCKRDSPDLSNAERFIPTIAYLISRKHEEYREDLIDVLLKKDAIPTDDIQRQYDLLIGNLLPNVKDPLRTHVIAIDALDECGLPIDQRKIASCMLSLAETVPWIRIFVTSRPEPEICDILTGRCLDTDINKEEDTAADIELFVRTKMKGLKLTQFNKVDDLVKRAEGLFIWCSTLFKYLDTSRNPRRDICRFLDGKTKQNPLLQLYKLYDQILSSVIDMGHQDDNDVLQAILSIIYVCSGNRPLSVNAIASFLQHDSRFIDEDSESVSRFTKDLHAVLYEETNGHRALRVYHPSFLDYLKQKLTGSDGFAMNLPAVQRLMATGCLEIMHKELKFNICCLEDSYRLNKDIPDLEGRISTWISEALQYGSLFWFHHVSQCDSTAERDVVIRSVSALFMSPKALHWLEVMIFLDVLADGVAILQGSRKVFESGDIAQLMSDLERFVLTYAQAMESAPHIYLSALAWLPEETLAYKKFFPSFAHLPLVANKEPNWAGARWRMDTNYADSRCATLAADGERFATGHKDGHIRIWNARTTKQIHTLRHHTECIYEVLFSPDGCWLASRSEDYTIYIWRLATREMHTVLHNESDPTQLVFCVDGTRIAACFSGGKVCVWNVEPSAMIFSQTIYSHHPHIALSTDGKHILFGYESLEIWNIDTGAHVYTLGRFDNVSLSTYSRDGRYIAVAVKDGSGCAVKLWDAQTYEAIGKIPDIEDAECLSFTADGKQLYHCSRTGCIRTWLTETLALIKRIDLMIEGFETMTFYADADFRSVLVTEFAAISLFDVQYGVAGESPNTSLGFVQDAAISPDGRYIASCHYKDCSIYIWDGKTGVKVVEPLRGHSDYIEALTFSNDGRWLVSGSKDKTIRIWDVSSNWISGEPLLGHTGPVYSVIVSLDSNLIASRSCIRGGSTICIWKVSTRSLLQIFEDIWDMSFFPDSRRIAIASSKKGGRIFDVLTGEFISQFSDDGINIYSVVVSPNGQRVAYETQDTDQIIYSCQWDGTNRVKITRFYGEETKIVFTLDSRYLIVIASKAIYGLNYDDFELWDVESGEKNFVCSYPADCFISSLSNSSGRDVAFAGYRDELTSINICDDNYRCIYSDTFQENSGDSLVEKNRRVRWRDACTKWYKEGWRGWMKDTDGRLLLWIPFQYREDILLGRKLAIGNARPIRTVRPTIDCVKLFDWVGEGWTSVYRPTMK